MEPNLSVERPKGHTGTVRARSASVEEAITNFLIESYRDLDNRSPRFEGENKLLMTFLDQITGDIGSIRILPKSESARLLEAFYARLRTALISELLTFIDPINDDVQPLKFVGLGEFPEGHTINFDLDWRMAFLLSLIGYLYWDFGIELW